MITIATQCDDRKAMVRRLSEHLQTPAVYLYTPTYAFRIGEITVNRDASVSGEREALLPAAECLLENGYDKEYALIQLIEDSAERQAATDALNARYNENRRAAAQEYAALLADIVMPVWEQADIQQAAADVDALTQKLREYSTANETEKPALLEDLNAITAAMDEGAMTEYHQDSSVNFTGSTFYIREEKDVQALAIEIAALTRRRQHGRGLRMA